MTIDRSDRCMFCGAPFMSTLSPGEVDMRICYTCNTSPIVPDKAIAIDNDLNILQLNSGSEQLHTNNYVRIQGKRQIRKSGVQLARNSSSSSKLPSASAKTSRRVIHVKKRKNEAPLAIGIVTMMVLCAGTAIYMSRDRVPSKPVSRVEINAPKKEPTPLVKPATVSTETSEKNTSASDPQQPTQVVESQVAELKPASPPQTLESEQVAPVEQTVPAEQIVPAEKKQDLDAIFNLERSGARTIDDDAVEEMDIAKKAAAKANPSSAKKAENRAGAKTPDALARMGITGTNGSRPQDEMLEFDDIRKPKPIKEVTSTEPTILKENLTEGEQTPEKTFSQSIQSAFPGWRVRDVMLKHSKFTSTEHRGKKDVLVLNPINDVMPAKLFCTVEIPKDYSAKRPMLLFEISTKDNAADWYLSVKCMGIDIRSKTLVRCPETNKWQPVVVDLSPLSGKHFEVTIECYMSPKVNKKQWQEELAFIRNVQLTWSGKKTPGQ